MIGTRIPGPMRWVAGVLGVGLLWVSGVIVVEGNAQGWSWQLGLALALVASAGVDLVGAAWSGTRRGILGAVLLLSGL